MTLWKFTDEGVSDKVCANPVPLSATVVAVAEALLKMLRVPVALPTLSGWNQRVTEILSPGSIVLGGFMLPSVNGPDTVAFEITRATLPVFVMVRLPAVSKVT